MATLGGRAPIYAHVAEGDRADFRQMRQEPKAPEFSPFWGILRCVSALA